MVGYLRAILNWAAQQPVGFVQLGAWAGRVNVGGAVRHETEHQGTVRDGGDGRSCGAARGHDDVAVGPEPAAVDLAGLSRAAVRQAAPGRPGGQRARARRRLPAGAPGVDDPRRRDPRRRRRVGERDGIGRRRPRRGRRGPRRSR